MPVAKDGAEIAGSTAAQDWEAVRGASDIQYGPMPPVKAPDPPVPAQVPEWLKSLLEWLESVFKPFAELFGISSQVLLYIMLALIVVGLAVLAWRIFSPLARRDRKPADAVEEQWAPTRDAAVALLEDADRLAGEGRFGEAVHLLLRRSVNQIAEAQPDWLQPASTAREIAQLPSLPALARKAFAIIATRVERSFFALRDLDAEDWRAARTAYAEFALQKFAGQSQVARELAA